MKNILNKIPGRYFLIAAFFLSYSIYGQEVEPNDNIGDTGIFTIDTLGIYTGQFQQSGDIDLWYLAPGSKGDITLEVEQLANPLVIAAIHCNDNTYGLFGADPNATTIGAATPGVPANVFLDSTKFYTIHVASEIFNSEDYILTLSGSGALPVELTTFNSTVRENEIILSWKTATETNNYGFEVERSTQKQNWEYLGFVRGNGTISSPQNYSFVDKTRSTASSYFYRLKQIDNDGSFEYSKIIEAIIGVPATYQLEQNYPNPFNPSTVIGFTLPEEGFTKLTVFNSLGQNVKILINENLDAGYHQYNFNAANITSGVYYYKIEVNNFVKSNKMLLLK